MATYASSHPSILNQLPLLRRKSLLRFMNESRLLHPAFQQCLESARLAKRYPQLNRQTRITALILQEFSNRLSKRSAYQLAGTVDQLLH